MTVTPARPILRFTHPDRPAAEWHLQHRPEVDGTPWLLLYVPTGQDLLFGSDGFAAQFIADPDNTAYLRDLAKAALTAADGPETAGRARRVLAIHDGQLHPDDATGVCLCGGYLALARHQVDPDAVDRHVDACHNCYLLPLGLRRTCETLHHHQPCTNPHNRPDPVHCDHPRCTVPAEAVGPRCVRDNTWCCGCCHEPN
jgi:hypothetical protein